MRVDEIFNDMKPNPHRKLYSLNIAKAICVADFQDWIEEFCVYPFVCDGTQILFVSDANPFWISSEFFKSKVGHSLTIMSPSSFLTNNNELWLYAFYFHKAQGYVYSESCEKTAEERLKMLYNHL